VTKNLRNIRGTVTSQLDCFRGDNGFWDSEKLPT